MLTRDQLNDIRIRRKGDADVKVLLDEIRRMRPLLLRAHDYLRLLDGNPNIATAIGDVLKAELEKEPCVIESKRPAQPEDG